MTRYPASALYEFATALLAQAGLDADKAQTTAEILVEGDLLGHTTHGLTLLAPYLADLDAGGMAKSGEPRVVADFPAAVTWDGMHLPGPWLTVKAIELAMRRAEKTGTCTVVVRRSHHIACLAAYLKRVADAGRMILLSASDPSLASVAPHGGRRGVYTPNPIAAAWPTDADPVILDVSTSITSLGVARRLRVEQRRLPGPWLIDAHGVPTDDPAVLAANPPGSLLPVGGLDHGHKGYALGLLVEALTGGLAGLGRADPSEGWTANVFLQVLDPALFGGRDDFLRQTTWLTETCRQTPPRAGFEHVRLPGETALQRRAAQLAGGVELHPSVVPSLALWAEKLGVRPPAPT